MSEKAPLTPEENAKLRKLLRKSEAEKTKAAQESSERLTREYQKQYGPLVR